MFLPMKLNVVTRLGLFNLKQIRVNTFQTCSYSKTNIASINSRNAIKKSCVQIVSTNEAYRDNFNSQQHSNFSNFTKLTCVLFGFLGMTDVIIINLFINLYYLEIFCSCLL